MQFVEVPNIAIGSPAEIASARIAEINMRKLVEPTHRVKARGQLVGERLIMDKAICASRADRLFVKVHGIERAAFDPGDLRPDQRGAILEVPRANCRPDLELSVVSDQSLDMLPSLAGRCGLAGCRLGERTVKV